jgi:hypothetical protein
MYHKTLYHDKAAQYISSNPLCHVEMYYTMVTRIATSKYVKNKSLLILIVPAACIAVVRMYSAHILFMLPIDHPIRKAVRKLVRKA